MDNFQMNGREFVIYAIPLERFRLSCGLRIKCVLRAVSHQRKSARNFGEIRVRSTSKEFVKLYYASKH